jgi:hypothetical protein
MEGDEGKKRMMTAKLLEKKWANRPWLLGMLAALNPGSKVFRQPSLPENCSVVDVHTFCANQIHGIFTGGYTMGMAQREAYGFGVFE